MTMISTKKFRLRGTKLVGTIVGEANYSRDGKPTNSLVLDIGTGFYNQETIVNKETLKQETIHIRMMLVSSENLEEV